MMNDMASLKRLAAGLVFLLLTVVCACGGNSSPNNLPEGVKEGFGDFPKNALAPTMPSPGCSVQNKAYEGYTPAPAGCACKTNWSYSGHTYCNGECDNPDNDPNGALVFYAGDMCASELGLLLRSPLHNPDMYSFRFVAYAYQRLHLSRELDL
jgi:hypothetical protein